MTDLCLCGFTLTKRGRFWAVRDKDGSLVCLTVYKKGAHEVIRRLSRATETKSVEQEDILLAPVSVRPRIQKPRTRTAYTVHEL